MSNMSCSFNDALASQYRRARRSLTMTAIAAPLTLCLSSMTPLAAPAAAATFEGDCVFMFNRDHCSVSGNLVPLGKDGLLVDVYGLSGLLQIDLTGDPRFEMVYRPVEIKPIPFEQSASFTVEHYGTVDGTAATRVADVGIRTSGIVLPNEVTARFDYATSPEVLVEVRRGRDVVGSEITSNVLLQTPDVVSVERLLIEPQAEPPYVEIYFTESHDWSSFTSPDLGRGGVLRFSSVGASREIEQLESAIIQTENLREYFIDRELPQCTVPALDRFGECPGEISLRARCVIYDSVIWLLAADGPGEAVIPFGPCAGTPLGLDASARLIGSAIVDPTGVATFGPRLVDESLCGNIWLQAVDSEICTATNVILVE